MIVDWFTVTTSRPGSAAFERRMGRSYYFVSLTVLVALSVSVSALVLLRLTGLAAWDLKGWIFVAIWALTIHYLRVVRDWKRILKLHTKTAEPGTELYTALEVAAAHMFYGMVFSALIASGLTVALGKAILESASGRR